MLWLAEYAEKWKTHTLADDCTSNMQYLLNYRAPSECKRKAIATILEFFSSSPDQKFLTIGNKENVRCEFQSGNSCRGLIEQTCVSDRCIIHVDETFDTSTQSGISKWEALP